MNSILIIGAGKSGIASALLAKRQGFDRIFVTEKSSEENYSDAKRIFEANSIEFEFGKHSFNLLSDFELVVVSPGVPPDAEIIVEAERLNKRIVSEVEFAYSFCKNSIIGITGTNGKTTTTALIEFILNTAGKKAIAVGNIGAPFSDYVDKVEPETIFVLELSSYQLDRIEKFKPDVAIILNITPDHLKYHKTFSNYRNAKFRIFANQKENDLLILNFDDKETLIAKSQAGGKVAYFGLKPVEFGAYLNGDEICLRFPENSNEEVVMKAGDIKIPGVHNLYNSLASIVAVRSFEVQNEQIRYALMNFQGVEHRLEFVREIDGVTYINDSKATNVDSAYYALSSYTRPIIWIAGGRSDNNDYDFLDDVVEKNVKAIVLIGEAKGEIFNHFCTMKRCYLEDSLEEAVHRAREIADEGDIVLLSPACKSFDMFRNFEHRGQVFKEIVNSLK
ncbi:MAG: UDP-N-acetylmuramoylalanine--D-glutamate ligase [Candidatus Kapaibacterium sp.]|nr:MAG: UDP-N-acetylmuramoylalanine--D-glutamate ligase [Candidatus Kapabacteria bacterium]